MTLPEPADQAPVASPASEEETTLVEALRRGDENAFAALIDTYHSALLRLALSYVATREQAEDVVQETWLGVLNGIDRFEGRSSLKTWIFRILVNRAKTKGVRERRSVPFSSLEADADENEPSVDPSRFKGDTRSAGFWTAPPESWASIPEDRLLSAEIRAVVDEAISLLPAMQRAVITLRDIRGFSSQEACEVLGLTEANQRVLLHRARSKIRARLEEYLRSANPPGTEELSPAAPPSAATARTTPTGPTSTGPTSTGPTSTGPTSTGPTSTGSARRRWRLAWRRPTVRPRVA